MAHKFKVGDKVQLKENVSKPTLDLYGLKVGDEGTVIRGHYGYYDIDIYCSKNGRVNTLSFETRFLELVKGSSRDKLEARIETLKQEIAVKYTLIDELATKLGYMDEIGTDHFDENEFKAYQTLSIIEKGGLSKLEKAKAIAALLNQK